MSSSTPSVVLNAAELRDVDEKLLDYLSERAVTPHYCRLRLEKDGFDYTRGYVQERLSRLAEHKHAENLLDSGLYELRDDPRDH